VEGFNKETTISSLHPTVVCVNHCTCIVQLVILITIELSFNCIFPDTSHCDFTFNPQKFYWRLFIALDVESTIFIEPNLVREILSDSDQNTSRDIHDNVKPHDFGFSYVRLNDKMLDNVWCHLYQHIVCSCHLRFINMELVIVESITYA
jgi:hypothetical protein